MAFSALIAPTMILLAGVVDDLRSRKVHNILVLISFAIAISVTYYLRGSAGIFDGLLAMGTALLLTLPLVLVRVLGAGDMKLLVAFAVSVHWEAVLTTVVASLIWGSILGLVRAIVGGHGKVFAKNLVAIVTRQKIDPVTVTKIPFTIAMFFGWLSYLAIESAGGRL